MILAPALVLALTAAPTWKLEVDHREDAKGMLVYQGNMNKLGLSEPITESYALTVVEAGDRRPKAVQLEPAGGKTGRIDVTDERGEAAVRFEKPPAEARVRDGFGAYLGRLVLEDPLRSDMMECDPASKDATEKWLRQMLAAALLASASEVTFKELKVRCAKTKSGVVREVTVGVHAVRGRSDVQISLAGKVFVDPAVWVTTWKLSGPMRSVVDTHSMAMTLGGTFTSALSLAKKK